MPLFQYEEEIAASAAGLTTHLSLPWDSRGFLNTQLTLPWESLGPINRGGGFPVEVLASNRPRTRDF